MLLSSGSEPNSSCYRLYNMTMSTTMSQCLRTTKQVGLIQSMISSKSGNALTLSTHKLPVHPYKQQPPVLLSLVNHILD